MTELTKFEQKKRSVSAIAVRKRKQKTYQKQRQKLAESGHCQTEVWMPVEKIQQIKVLVNLFCRVLESEITLPEIGFIPDPDHQPEIAPTSDTFVEPPALGLGYLQRRRIQSQRTRSRKKEKGHKKVRLVIPIAHRQQLLSSLSKVKIMYSKGFMPDLEQLLAAHPEPADRAALAPSPQPSSLNCSQTPVQKDHLETDNQDDDEIPSALFNDIKALGPFLK